MTVTCQRQVMKSLVPVSVPRGSSALLLNELTGFTLPDWMLEKAKAQMMAMRTDSLKDTKPVITTTKLPEQVRSYQQCALN